MKKKQEKQLKCQCVSTVKDGGMEERITSNKVILALQPIRSKRPHDLLSLLAGPLNIWYYLKIVLLLQLGHRAPEVSLICFSQTLGKMKSYESVMQELFNTYRYNQYEHKFQFYSGSVVYNFTCEQTMFGTYEWNQRRTSSYISSPTGPHVILTANNDEFQRKKNLS